VSYIQHVLQPGETIRDEGSVHWILYLPAIILMLVAAAIFAAEFFGGVKLRLGFSWRLLTPEFATRVSGMVHPLDDKDCSR
jgi:hypothetical protein